MGETDDSHVSLEDGPGGGSDCEARWTACLEADGGRGETGRVSGNQEKVVQVELMS